MTLEELVARRKIHIEDAKAIADLAKEDKRDLTEEEESKVDDLLAKAETLAEQIKTEETRLEKSRERTMALQAANESLTASRGRITEPEPIAENLAGVPTGQVRERVQDDPARGYATPRHFILDVMNAGSNRRLLNPDGLKFLKAPDAGALEATAGSDEQGGYADPYGGFLVPETFTPDMLKIAPEADPMGSRVRRVPMATPTVKFPARTDKDHSSSVSGGLTVGRKAEAIAATASRMTVEEVTMTADSLFGLAYCTEELLRDSPISFAALLEQGFSEEFQAHIINERMNGTGVGQFLGVLTSGCVVSITKETNQAADTIVYENIIKMRARCWGYNNALWLANQDCIPQLMLMNHTIGAAGTPVWQPSAREDMPDLLLGRPMVFTEFCKTVGDKGDLVLGNWNEYLEGIYQPLESAESIHVRFTNHERAFKFWIRNAGAPWWRSALTPKNSSNTLSPFVVIAARA